jgi:hAT family C-terminal dimerisation region
MSLSKLMAGRKRESGAWKWFDYDEKIDKTACLVKLKTGKLCTMLLSGKNSTINDDSHGTNTESPPGSGSIQGEISQYLGELRTLQPRAADALAFWNERRATYSKLAPIAEDLLAAPASQAFVERIFSLCGWLTAGRRNRMQKSLEMRVFLKLNRDLLAH